MRSKFKLEIDVVMDTDAAPRVIEVARQCYLGAGATTVDNQGTARAIPAEEFIDGIEDALMELLERNPLLVNANVEVEGVLCRTDAATLTAGLASETGEPSEKTGSSADDPLAGR
jgi:hypothetical protein